MALRLIYEATEELRMQFKRIVAAIDTSDEIAPAVLTTAASLAKKDNADLRVVCVWPHPGVDTAALAADIGVNTGVTSQAALEQHRKGRVQCEIAMKSLVDEYAPGTNAIILDGDASEEVSKLAKEIDADIIVTGSHQRGFWGSLLHGSASREVIHEAPCAVFIVTKAFAERSD